MLGVGRDLCGSSSPTLLPKQGHLQQAAQELVQAGLEYLQRRRLHNLPGQPVPVLRHPQREEVLPHVQTELPVPQFVTIAPCPVTGHHWKELGPNIYNSGGVGLYTSVMLILGCWQLLMLGWMRLQKIQSQKCLWCELSLRVILKKSLNCFFLHYFSLF